MPPDRNIETSKPPTVVTYVVKIDGSEIPQKYKADVMVISKEINRIPSARITIVDGNPADAKFEASDEQLFVPGSEIEISAGYQSDNQILFKGIIIKQGIKIRANNSLLIVDCKDKAVKMTVGKKSKFYPADTKDSDVFSELCGNYGLTTDIEATSISHKELVQYDVTDWDFMLSRADVNGRVCITNDGAVSIKKPDLGQSPVLSLVYGATVLEFDAEIDARYQVKAVQSRSWSSDDQKVLEKDAPDPAVSLNGNLTSAKLADVIGLDTYYQNHGGNITDTELEAWGESFWLKQQLAKVRGRLRCRGIHTVVPGTIIELSGISERFNGKCYVSGVQHHISAGDWQTDIQFGINPEWFSNQFNTTAIPSAGLIPAINGLQIGVVTKLESDPEGRFRIKVNIPVIKTNDEGIWARLATLDAGKERGSFFLPEIKDEVIVGFINDDPRNAVVLGMVNSSSHAAPLTAADANNQKGFVTRSKMKMIFDDEKKSFTLETPKGKKVSVDEDKGVIQFEDENSNKIVMDSNGISIESSKEIKLKATTDIKMEGVNIESKASAALKSEGSASAEVKSSGTTTIKGSMVMIN